MSKNWYVSNMDGKVFNLYSSRPMTEATKMLKGIEEPESKLKETLEQYGEVGAGWRDDRGNVSMGYMVLENGKAVYKHLSALNN